MIRREASFLSFKPLRLAAATLFVVACSPASEAPPAGTGGSGSGTGGSGSSTGGFGNSTGGFSSSTGGFSSSTGGSATSTGGMKSTGGTTSTGGSGTSTGGTATTTGGTATTTGGTATATGGSGGAASCNTYNGTLATSGASKIFMDGFGTATTGMWKGYAYTYTYGTGAVVKPATGTMECFKGTALCAAGTVPALDTAGIGVGWNINQGVGTTTALTAPITGSIKFVLAGAKANMRLALGGTAAGDEYCYTLTAADATAAATGLVKAAADFKKECWDTAKATAYAGSEIKSIQVGVPGSMTGGATTFDFCLVDIEPG